MGKNRSILETWLLNHFVTILGYPKEAVDLHSSMENLGIESMAITALGRLLEPHFPTLSKTFIYDCRTIADVVDYLSDGFSDEVDILCRLQGNPDAKPEEKNAASGAAYFLDTWEPLASMDAQQNVGASDAIAVIGMAGRFPDAPDLAAFARNLSRSASAIKEIPVERWPLEGFYMPEQTGRASWASISKWGGFLDDADCFDAEFFGIASRDADVMDPQERLFLECAWHAMESAALGPERLPRDKASIGFSVGTFVGMTTLSYSLLGPELWRSGNGQIPASMPWSVANRVSYLHNFTGPSLAVDTACSSSLTALHLACASLRAGECAVAIAGGVNLYLHPAKYVQLSQQKMLSPTGHCQAFGAGADGFVPGEGVGAVVLRPLRDALAAGDRILGVIRASTVQHGGRTNGYTVPSALAQAALIRSVLVKADVEAASIGYVEAHGTGTSLGDPIEVDALSKAFHDGAALKPAACALGSVKSNIGHLESASGIAGLIKILLQFQHNMIFPTLHVDKTNPTIDFSRSPFRLPVSAENWPRTQEPRRAALSSFGAGGANAHLLIEEGPAPLPLACQTFVSQVFVFSATDHPTLSALVAQCRDWLTGNVAALDPAAQLGRLAYTLQLGRTALRHRLAFVADDRASLLAAMARFEQQNGSGHSPAERYYSGVARAGAGGAGDVFGDPDAIAQAWVGSDTVTWSQYWSVPLLPLDLPGYPFTRARHWVAQCAEVKQPATPLGGRSDIALDHDDWRVREHVVDGQSVFPAAAYLQLAADLAQRTRWRMPLEFRNLMWARAVVVTAATVLRMDLSASGELSVTDPVETQARAIFKGGIGTASSTGGRADPARAQSFISPIDRSEFYTRFERLGIRYGAHFRTVVALQREGARAVALLRPDPATPPQGWIDPALLDGVLQCALALAPEEITSGDRAFVPFSLKNMTLWRPLSGPVRVTIFYRGSPGTGLHAFDFHLENEAGEAIAQVNELCFRAYQQPGRRSASAEPVAAQPAWHLAVPAWHARQQPALPRHSIAGPILLVGDALQRQQALGARLPAVLPEAALCWLESGPCLRYRSGRLLEADLNDAGQLAGLCRLLREEGAPPSHLVYCAWSGTHDATAVTALDHVRRFANLVRALVADLGNNGLRLVYLYHGDGRDEHAPYHQAVSGLLRTVHLEMPRVSGQVICVDRGADAAATALDIADALTSASTKPLTTNRGDGRAGVQELDWLAGGAIPWTPTKRAVYVITGGLGALGRLFGHWLATRCGVRLALVGRAAVDADGSAFIDELRQAGAEVDYFQGDVARPDDACRVLAGVRARFGAINGVLHGAGVLRDAFFVQQSDAHWSAVLAPKIDGTTNLDQLTRGDALEAFILFSSLAGVYGNVGQAVYAYANAWQAQFAQLRALAAQRGQCHGKTLAVSWPLWKTGTGMQAPRPALDWMRERGLGLLDAGEGIAALQGAMASSHAHVIVCKGSRASVGVLLDIKAEAAPPSAASAWVPAPRAVAAASPDPVFAREPLVRRLAALLSEVSGMKLERLLADTPIQALGLDSIMVMELNAALELHFKTLPKTLFFEIDTLGDLADRLIDAEPQAIAGFAGDAVRQPAHDGATAPVLDPGDGAHGAAAPVRARTDTALPARATDIAIVGIAGRYPKASDLRQFWRNLDAGLDCVVDVAQRWPDLATADGPAETPKSGAYAHWAALIDDFDAFDPLHFGIAPRDAERMDPQERLFLETSWLAVENAGYTPESLQRPRSLHGARARVGVLAGVMYGEYQLYGAAGSPTPTNSSFAAIANRVSSCLGLNGPSFALDSMCSSSLTAVHLACTLLGSGSCDAILAGGVNLSVHPYRYRMLSELQFAASDGRCRSFGEGGDGYVPGEGVGVVLLKRLEDAIADGDHISGVIRGSAVGHGGRTSGFTVPSPHAQAEVIRQALQAAGASLSDIGYVEAHGTGTSLGDPIEMRGLMLALGDDIDPAFRCPVGSVKSQIGHLESAAGIAALTKVLLQFEHRRLAPSLHSERLNPNIAFAELPFFVQREAAPWPDRTGADGQVLTRLAAVSSFGAGGSNAHLVVAEYRAALAPDGYRAQQELFVFSARGAAQLRALAQNFATFLDEAAVPASGATRIALGGGAFTLSDVAATLREGRVAHANRLALVASDFSALRTLLRRALTDAAWTTPEFDVADGIYRGVAQSADETAAPSSADSALETIARAWVVGGLPRWPDRLVALEQCRRVPLPATVLVKKRYWAKPAPPPPSAVPVTGAALRQHDPGEAPRAVYEKVLSGELTYAQAKTLLTRQIRPQATAPIEGD